MQYTSLGEKNRTNYIKKEVRVQKTNNLRQFVFERLLANGEREKNGFDFNDKLSYFQFKPIKSILEDCFVHNCFFQEQHNLM